MVPKVFSMEVCYLTDRGLIKEKNEDSILAERSRTGKTAFGLFAVADGVGGSELGKEAGCLTTKLLKEWKNRVLCGMVQSCCSFEQLEKSLKTEIEMINLSVFEIGDNTGKSAATTLSAMLIYGDAVKIIHIGDSRIYRMRGKRLQLLTEDHTWIKAQIKSGALTEAAAKVHKNRHAITRCIGKTQTCDLFEKTIELRVGDIFLLCSDGFYEYFDEDTLSKELAGGSSAWSYAELLEQMVDRIYEKGARDNISAIIIKIKRQFPWWRGAAGQREETDEEDTIMV